MNDQTVEHLKLISEVAGRMGRNSFQLKAWTVVVVGAVFALATRQVDYRFYLVGLLPVLMFWGLDAYYLWRERHFRALFDAVRKDEHNIGEHGMFSMDTTPYDGIVPWWGRICVSRTIAFFYAPLVVAIGLASAFAFVAERAD